MLFDYIYYPTELQAHKGDTPLYPKNFWNGIKQDVRMWGQISTLNITYEKLQLTNQKIACFVSPLS